MTDPDKAALAEVCALLSRVGDNPDFGQLLIECRRRAEATELQLEARLELEAGEAACGLERARRAADPVAALKRSVAKVAAAGSRMPPRIVTGHELVQERKRVLAALRGAEEMSRLPARVKGLRRALRRRPEKVFQIYVEWRSLDAWRREVLKEARLLFESMREEDERAWGATGLAEEAEREGEEGGGGGRGGGGGGEHKARQRAAMIQDFSDLLGESALLVLELWREIEALVLSTMRGEPPPEKEEEVKETQEGGDSGGTNSLLLSTSLNLGTVRSNDLCALAASRPALVVACLSVAESVSREHQKATVAAEEVAEATSKKTRWSENGGAAAAAAAAPNNSNNNSNSNSNNKNKNDDDDDDNDDDGVQSEAGTEAMSEADRVDEAFSFVLEVGDLRDRCVAAVREGEEKRWVVYVYRYR